MKYPFNAKMPAFDAARIHETIQRALSAAGLDTSTGAMQHTAETLRHALAAGHPATTVQPRERTAPVEAAHGPGSLRSHQFSNSAGTRSYKVYEPLAPTDAQRPMIVMLHGCTQSADDFAAGTQMNRLAEAHGFLVVYPEQAADANTSKCWNWFKPQDQLRDAGEPSLIAGIVREVAHRHGADPRRIFVAGLSAGAAMAVVLGETYPELFAGVGAHSGLPYGSAHDIASALAAMKGGRGLASGLNGSGLNGTTNAAGGPKRQARQAVPVIVFHGDRDHTVQATNGAQIVQQAQQAHAARASAGELQVTTQSGIAAGGQRYSRAVHVDAAGQACIESWTLHGAGHAWSGGHPSGSYTQGAGPDASAEMLRFFLALPRAGAA